MNNISQNVLDKIKQEHLTPKPKWHFVLMHALLWGALVMSIGLGSLAMAISVRHLSSTPWEMVILASKHRWHTWIVVLPYLWLIFLGVTVLAASWLFAHTKKGYRVRPVWVGLGSVLLSFLLGLMLYFVRVDQPIEDQLQKRSPLYMKWRMGQEEILMFPEEGLLVGKIVRINLPEEILLMDPKRIRWEVDLREAKYGPLEKGMKAGIVGEKTGENTFKASFIRPLPPFRKALPAPLGKREFIFEASSQ